MEWNHVLADSWLGGAIGELCRVGTMGGERDSGASGVGHHPEQAGAVVSSVNVEVVG